MSKIDLVNGGRCLTYANNDLDNIGACCCFDCQDQISDEAYQARLEDRAAALKYYKEQGAI